MLYNKKGGGGELNPQPSLVIEKEKMKLMGGHGGQRSSEMMPQLPIYCTIKKNEGGMGGGASLQMYYMKLKKIEKEKMGSHGVGGRRNVEMSHLQMYCTINKKTVGDEEGAGGEGWGEMSHLQNCSVYIFKEHCMYCTM